MTLKSNLFRVATTVGLTAILALAMAAPAPAAVETYNLDRSHTLIGYTVRHVVSNFTGNFRKFKGTITVDPADLKTAKVDVTIWANAIDTGNPGRDKHLMSDAFFNAAVDSLITFKSTAVNPAGKESGTITGDLTMRGVTKPVTLNYTVLGFVQGERGKKAGFQATGVINRKDFGVSWNSNFSPETLVLGDEVKLNFEIEANQFDPNAPPPAPKK